jgi:hypothetical protein
MPTTSKLDVNQLDKDISNLEEPTASALTEALQAVADERAGLQRLQKHIQARLETLDEMEATLRSIAPSGSGRSSRGATSTARKRTAKKATKKSTRKRTSRRSSVPVGDIIEKELRTANSALTMDQLAERVERSTGRNLDRRGLAGALNGGVRSGRFIKTPTGSFKLPTPSSAI